MSKPTAEHQHVAAIVAELDQWLDPIEYERELGKFATRHSILRDIHNRAGNGLEAAGVIRKVGRRFLVHRSRYTAYRLGELNPKA